MKPWLLPAALRTCAAPSRICSTTPSNSPPRAGRSACAWINLAGSRPDRGGYRHRHPCRRPSTPVRAFPPRPQRAPRMRAAAWAWRLSKPSWMPTGARCVPKTPPRGRCLPWFSPPRRGRVCGYKSPMPRPYKIHRMRRMPAPIIPPGPRFPRHGPGYARPPGGRNNACQPDHPPAGALLGQLALDRGFQCA